MKNKGIALLIADRVKKSKSRDHEEDEDREDEDYEGDDLEVAAEDILDAIADSDPAALSEALKSFIELCE